MCLATKIIRVIENTIAKKESMLIIDKQNITLEDYFETINSDNTLNNLIVIDYKGNILNFVGRNYITKSEIINFKNKSNTTVRIGYTLDINNVKQVTNAIIGIPQITEVSGQISSMI